MKFDIDVLNDGFAVGYDEDGRVRYAPRYRLIMTNAAGRCWQSTAFWDATVEETEDGIMVDDAAARRDATDAKWMAQFLLLNGRRLDPTCWEEIAPAYGSPVWQREAHRWEGIPQE